METSKNHDLIDWYRNYEGKKTSYINFANRVLRQGYTKEKAILDVCYTGKRKIKTKYDTNGRVCIECKKYKERKHFHKSSGGLNRRTPNCIDCRNKRKRAYRLKTGYVKDREYKKRVRTLEVGTKIILLGEQQDDLLLYGEIQKREVVEYKHKKGYRIQSDTTKYYRNIDIGDNKKSVKYLIAN